MSISMRLSCNVPRNGCLPRFLRTHGDMNEAMSHACIDEGESIETNEERLSGAAVREASGDKGSRQSVGVQSHVCKGSTWRTASRGSALYTNPRGWKLCVSNSSSQLGGLEGAQQWARHIISIFSNFQTRWYARKSG